MKTQEQEMTHEEKVNYFRIGCNLCRYGFTNEQADLLLSIYEAILEHKGSMDLAHLTQIEIDSVSRERVRGTQKMLDKVSLRVGR